MGVMGGEVLCINLIFIVNPRTMSVWVQGTLLHANGTRYIYIYLTVENNHLIDLTKQETRIKNKTNLASQKV